MAIDIDKWISDGTADRGIKKQAMHTALVAIALSSVLSKQLVFKGGALLALRYQTGRYTKDLDFSVQEPFVSGAKKAITEELDNMLRRAEGTLPYGLACKTQKIAIKPRPEATFVGMKITIGYAYRRNMRQMKHFNRGQSSTTISMDVSFNEPIPNVEHLELSGGWQLQAFSLVDILAEKFRAMLQQPERHRFRRQDVYDLCFLIKNQFITADIKRDVLASLRVKSAGRLPRVHREGVADPAVRRHSLREYHQLQHEITGELPAFDEVYAVVQDFYESLPWES